MKLRTIQAGVLMLLGSGACCNDLAAQDAAPRPPPSSLLHPSGTSQPVDQRGFIRRWLVLEPISVAGQLTQGAVETALRAGALPDAATSVPREGDASDVTGSPRWHAVESRAYNVNLYHFAWSLSKPTSNVLFWAVSTVDAPADMPGVRLATCSNAASRWWLNGESVVSVYGDRQSVIDDGVSRRLTLHKGRNVIRAAIINGGGATDFCARFLDAEDQPITSLRVTLAPASN
jgi:hypothetical protein